MATLGLYSALKPVDLIEPAASLVKRIVSRTSATQ
jgi:hypothetical protein